MFSKTNKFKKSNFTIVETIANVNIATLNGISKSTRSEENGANEEDLFGTLVAKLGNDGKYQNRINIFYNFFLILLTTMSLFNVILVMAVPEHWCHVRGRKSATIEEWKILTIPK